MIGNIAIFVTVFFSAFLLAELQDIQALARRAELGSSHVNFVEHPFHKLDVNAATQSSVTSSLDCHFACLRVVTCFSFNMAANPDVEGRTLCELLSTDMYNSSGKFKANPFFHHHSIYTPCAQNPCVHGGKCMALYSLGDFKCICSPGFEGKKCESDVNECKQKKHTCSSNATCQNTEGSFKCKCKKGYHGDGINCTAATNCAECYKSGNRSNGVYTIYPDEPKPFDVFCDQNTARGGWTVLQKRLDGSVDFYRGWADYKRGFGNLSGEFWLGLDKIYRLTTQTSYKLRVELEDFEGNTVYEEYDMFSVSSEASKYKLSLESSYTGTAGDSLYHHVGMAFTTKDKDNDKSSRYGNCAVSFKGAWWYKDCLRSNLNGIYHHGQHSSYADGINWKSWNGYYYSAKRAEMKIRPVDF